VDRRPIAERLGQQLGHSHRHFELTLGGAMHVGDQSVEQLHPGARGHDAEPLHRVVLRHVEPSEAERMDHRQNLASHPVGPGGSTVIEREIDRWGKG
jgi:hypothetical protein